MSSVAFATGGYFRFPALHGDTLVFTAEGDLWKVPAAGGDAQRLTTHAGAETHAAISPDGQWIAFSASYEGPTEVYVMPIAGGLPKRLTWFGSRAEVVGWTPQGDVLVSTRHLHPLGRPQLVTVSRASDMHRVIPVENADTAAFVDANTLVFTRDNQRGDNVRSYRGGATSTLWRINAEGGAEAVALTPGTSNSAVPMPWKGRIVFLSDRDGVMNLWSMNRDGRDARQHTRHSAFEVRRAAISGERVAYQHGADLRIHDLATGQDRAVPIRLISDFDQQRERWIRRPLERFAETRLSNNGDRAVIVARGRVVTAGIGNLRRVEIALPPASRARSAAFMPDGKSVLVICDVSGENELWLFPADGSGPGRQLTRDADIMRWEIVPSPDGKWIAHHDRKQRLWLLDVASGRNQLLAQGETFGRYNFGSVKWSPDSSALAAEVALLGDQGRRGIVLFRVADAQRFTVASQRYDSYSPTFSPDGRWLWFLSDRHFEAIGGTPWGERNMGPFFDKRTRAYAIALQPGNRFPFQPRDELAPLPLKPEASLPEASLPAASDAPAETVPSAKPATAKIPPIGWDGIEQRLFEVPLAPGNYTRLESDGRRLWFLDAETTTERKTHLKTLEIGNTSAMPQVFMADIRQFALSGDARKLLLRKWQPVPAAGTLSNPGGVSNPGDLYIVDVTPKPLPAPELPRFQVRLNDWQFTVMPREDWQQIFVDAWRLHRDWFYDANMHGVDWPAMRRKYEALLPRVTDREELSDLIAQMSAELSLLHSQVRFGDLRRGEDTVQPATLGAVFENASSGVRIVRVYQGDPEWVSNLPPLAQPGVAAKAGDIIVSIDGRPVKTVVELTAQLRQKAGRQVLLELRTGEGATRKTIVTPAAAPREVEFKRRDWVWQRRERVEAASKGRFGYLHLRAMAPADLADFARDFYPVHEREGLIIDVRQNSGGNIDSIVIEKLMRRAWAYWQDRNGRQIWNMQGAFRGHIVLLIDAGTYSDGEALAEGMRRLGLATLVGKRTAGAGVWLSDSNRQVDGGMARAAEMGQLGLDGQWLIEGKGVEPDIEVDNLPHATFKGEDAQLAAAIRVLEEKLAAKPLVVPPAAVYPKILRK
jgi:tricorn protease